MTTPLNEAILSATAYAYAFVSSQHMSLARFAETVQVAVTYALTGEAVDGIDLDPFTAFAAAGKPAQQAVFFALDHLRDERWWSRIDSSARSRINDTICAVVPMFASNASVVSA